MKLFFIVGEDSGDDLGAALVRELKAAYGDQVECLGVGGARMKAAGFNELLPMDQISVIGLWEVIPKIPRLIKINKAIVEEIEKQQPDAVITIDFPDFNFILAKSLKKRGIYKGKLIHYVAPSVWAWRPERAKKIAAFLDGILCLFPMEVEHFTKHGLKAAYIGHPLVEQPVDKASPQDFRKENDIPENVVVLGLFFGSRETEFKGLGEIIKKAAFLVSEVKKDLVIVAPTLPKLEYGVQSLLEGFSLPVYVVANPRIKWDAFKACDVAIAVSGTVALELAYAGVPHIVTYRVNPITALILKLLVKVKFAHLANILLNKEVVPEYLQGKCSPEALATGIVQLLKNGEQKEQQIKDFGALREILGGNDSVRPSQKAVAFLQEIISTPAAVPAPSPVEKLKNSA